MAGKTVHDHPDHGSAAQGSTTSSDEPRTAGADAGPSAAAWVLQLPIRLYKKVISPILPPTCRFYPSCSSYAVEALRVHGAVRGSWLTVRRLARCGPWHPGGLDPVPPRTTDAAGAEPAAGESDRPSRTVEE